MIFLRLDFVKDCLAAMSSQDWERFSGCFHESMGAVLGREGAPLILKRDALVERLKERIGTLPPGTKVVERMCDGDEGVHLRVCGDLALLWAPFVVEIDGVVTHTGVNVFRMLKMKDTGKWMIVAFGDVSKTAS